METSVISLQHKEVQALKLRAAPHERHDGGVGEQRATSEAHALQPRVALCERHDGGVSDQPARIR